MAVVVQRIPIDSGDVFVIQEGVLEGGTKQRGATRFLQNINRPIVTFGAGTGFGQVALAIASRETGIPVHFFTHDLGVPAAMEKAASIAPTMHHIHTGEYNALADAAQTFAHKNDFVFVPMGLESPEFVDIMVQELNAAFYNWNPDYRTRIKTLWLASGSGTLLKILDRVLPSTQFLVVQVGRALFPDQMVRGLASPVSDLFVMGKINPQQHELAYPGKMTVVDSIPFNRDLAPNRRPPYSSVASYDAKVWPCVLKHGQAGDYIFNVAAL